MEIFLAAAASLLVQTLKNVFETSEYMTLAVLLVVSLGIAGVYASLQSLGLWETLVPIIVWAGAIYTYFLQRFEHGSALRRTLDNL
jgi:hypothetical protein